MIFSAVAIPSVGFNLIDLISLAIQRLGWTVSIMIGGMIAFAVIRSALSFFRSSERDHAKKDYHDFRRRYYRSYRSPRNYARRAVYYRRRFYARRAVYYRRRYYRRYSK